MELSQRVLSSILAGAVWSLIGVGLVNEFTYWIGFWGYGMTVPAIALVSLVIAVCGYGFSRDWTLRETTTACAISALSFVSVAMLYFAWYFSTSNGFAAVISWRPA
ncbi:hypothetical protein [Haloprofundus salinisoli]|uniref:hypothetical protein n=1 Tax=Haloprofundus salinisoli TaxID=2876193 RepID=UPI001CCB3E18|nr:hypothetical protein [Haloprofundus salinisoli]